MVVGAWIRDPTEKKIEQAHRAISIFAMYDEMTSWCTMPTVNFFEYNLKKKDPWSISSDGERTPTLSAA